MTTRRTIRIEVTDFGEDGPGFDGPVSREHATLVREFEPTEAHSPAELVNAIGAWLNGQPRRIEDTPWYGHELDDAELTRAGMSPQFCLGLPCVLPGGHPGDHSPVTRLPDEPDECQHEAWERVGISRRCTDCRTTLADTQHCDFQLVDHLGPPRACVLPPGHKGEHYSVSGDS